jgi:signal transduction histidine kinase
MVCSGLIQTHLLFCQRFDARLHVFPHISGSTVKDPVIPTSDTASHRDPPQVAKSFYQKLLLPEVRIAGIYLILASMWIIGSDLWLTHSDIDEPKSGLIQTLKGLNFVITTAILLFLVLKHAYSGWRLAEQQRTSVLNQTREKFRSLSSHVQTLRENDRAEISREIHDELGQLLTGIQMQLRLIEDRLSDREDRTLNPLIDKLVETSELVDTTINSVQRISAGLRPSTLDHLGLAATLLGEAEQFSERTGIRCVLLVSEIPENLAPDLCTAAFRIFQESLTNVARHAEAKKVDASLSVTDSVLKLVVKDDGKGMEPSDAEDPQSLGLMGMFERAKNVGGQVSFGSSARKGTTVTFTIPFHPPHRDDSQASPSP